MEWLRLMKLVRWLVSTLLLAGLFELCSPAVDALLRPEPWYVEGLAMLGLLVAAGVWLAVTYWLGKMVRNAG